MDGWRVERRGDDLHSTLTLTHTHYAQGRKGCESWAAAPVWRGYGGSAAPSVLRLPLADDTGLGVMLAEDFGLRARGEAFSLQ